MAWDSYKIGYARSARLKTKQAALRDLEGELQVLGINTDEVDILDVRCTAHYPVGDPRHAVLARLHGFCQPAKLSADRMLELTGLLLAVRTIAKNC